jgi:methylated-DNA-[protein]-cysteine S-methyltransferase
MMQPDIKHYCRHKLIHRGLRCYFISADQQLIHLSFSREKHLAALSWLRREFPGSPIEECPCETLGSLISAYLDGNLHQLPAPTTSPFIERGTPFQREVWRLIARIPYGQTKTYGELAGMLGKKGAARAIGQACNANPVALFIPCHRVVGTLGLGGFAGGEQIKSRLLLLERNA